MLGLKVLSVSVVALALMACAQPDPSGEVSGQDVITQTEQETNWTVLPDESYIKFSALQKGETFEGEFTDFEAAILFYPENLSESSVIVSVPVKSVEAGNKDRNETLPAKAWFSAKAYPVATFKSGNFTETGDGGYLVKGSLSLKGITRDVELPFTLSPDPSETDETTIMSGTMALDRTDWNVGEDPWNTDEWVSKNITLDIRVSATRK